MLIVYIKLRVTQERNCLLWEIDSLSLLLAIFKIMMQITWEPISSSDNDKRYSKFYWLKLVDFNLINAWKPLIFMKRHIWFIFDDLTYSSSRFLFPGYKQHQDLNSIQPCIALHLETSHLLWTAEELTGFYMKCNTGLKWVNTSIDQCFSRQCPISIPPENIRKPKVFWRFQEV